MAEGTSPRENILSNLAKFLRREPDERIWPEIDRVIGLFMDAATDEDPAVTLRENCDLAMMLLALAEKSQETRFTAMCLARLCELDTFGVLLAAGFIERSVEEDADYDQLLAEVSDPRKLDMVDRFLSGPDRRNGSFRDYALRFTRRIAQGLTEEMTTFVQTNQDRAPKPSFPVRQAVLQATVGKDSRDSLNEHAKASAIVSGVELLNALREPELADSLLSLHIERFPPWLLRGLLVSVSRMRVRLDSQHVKKISSLMARPEEDIRQAALLTLIRLRPRGLAKMFHSVSQRMPALLPFLLRRLPLAPAGAALAHLDAMAKHSGGVERTALCSALCVVDPWRMRQALRLALADARNTPVEDREAVMALLPKDWQTYHAEPDTRLAGEPKEEGEDKRSKGKWLFGLGRGKKNAPETMEIRGESFSGRSFAGTYVNSSFTDTLFEDVRFEEVDIAHTSFTNCTFINCTFTGVVFTRTRFSQCRFQFCRFLNATLRHSVFRDLLLWRCRFQNAAFSHNFWSVIHFDEGYMLECAISDTLIRCCRIRGHLIRGSTLHGFASQGFVFEDSHVENTLMQGLDLQDTTVRGVSYSGCHISGARTDDPLLQALESDSREVDLEENDAAFSRGETLHRTLSSQGATLCAKAVALWYAMADTERTLCLFSRETRRRLSWAADKLGPERNDFVRMLPFLLHTDVFERQRGLSHAPPLCRIAAYTPDYSVLELARNHFPEAALPDDPPDPPPAQTPLVIEAVYTIGSLGTTAQSADSDIDYWVCARLKDVAPHKVKGLRAKLDAIEAWAAEQFGLEVYFFLMDVSDVRDNNFGFSDEESSGSAQARMLKEEFYRTMLPVAGKTPVWRLVPPGAGQQRYEQVLRQAAVLPTGKNLLDLGHVYSIPAEEYFGASLWQIVKALKSPFKSIIKFGLLERYSTAGEESRILLCDRIKNAVLQRDTALWRLDPYLALLQEVAEYYALARQPRVVNLLNFGFCLKSAIREQMAAMEFPARMEEKGLATLFTQRVFPGQIPFRELPLAEDEDIEGFMILAQRINKFLVNTYVRVSDRLGGQASALINDQDRTRLGRKIFAALAPRKHKVERLLAMKMHEDLISKLHFSAEKTRSRFTAWRVQGGRFNPQRQRFELKPLKSTDSAVELFAWLTANKLFHQDVECKADISISPLSVRDAVDLLTMLREFFPSKETFDTPLSETLQPERVTRAFLILNLLAPREHATIQEVSVVYSTNWGEMFTRTVPVQNSGVTLEPISFLERTLPQDSSKVERLGTFIPSRSRCPGVEGLPTVELEP